MCSGGKVKHLLGTALGGDLAVALFDPDRAGRELGDTLREAWYFREVRKQLAMGRQTEAQMIEVLAEAAGASAERKLQLKWLLEWLRYAGLIDTKSGFVVLAGTEPADKTPIPNKHDNKGDGKPPEAPTAPGDPESKAATTGDHNERQAEAVLSFSFDFSLTADDLSGLTPDQIRAVFEAVGTVMAIKATT